MALSSLKVTAFLRWKDSTVERLCRRWEGLSRCSVSATTYGPEDYYFSRRCFLTISLFWLRVKHLLTFSTLLRDPSVQEPGECFSRPSSPGAVFESLWSWRSFLSFYLYSITHFLHFSIPKWRMLLILQTWESERNCLTLEYLGTLNASDWGYKKQS
jgi:hypothetical protein